MDDLRLYHALFSTCSQKVRFALALKGKSYESRLIDLGKGEHLEDDYLAINPNGVVPTLGHGSDHVHDSSVILEYLDEVFPEPALAPADALGRARMRAWMRYFEEVPTTAIRAPSFNKLFMRSIAGRPAGENERLVKRMPLRRHLYQQMGDKGFSADIVAQSIERLDECIDRVDRALNAGGPFLMGAALSLADIVLLPTIVRMEDLAMAHIWAERPAFTRWYRHMQAEPAFSVTYSPVGARLAAPLPPDAP
jgi:glutathione S-transferase